MIEAEIRNRKGAKKVQDIPQEILQLLNEGKIPTVNLIEWLAIDQPMLIKNTFPGLGLKDCMDSILQIIASLIKPSTMSSIKLIGHGLYEYYSQHKTQSKIIELLSQHESDTLRCYASYLISLNTGLNIFEKLNQSKNLIADKHFGVREIAWMALRPELVLNLTDAINILVGWTLDLDENIRRFTTESIRPRGVWCAHIEELKENPSIALPILDSLKSDESKYVQNSLGNWLNDASKSKPEFVVELCKKWRLESKTKATEKIVKRALRTIEKRM